MKILDYLKSKQKPVSSVDANQPENEAAENSSEEVSGATKVKIVAALLIVGFATYVAYWVQEPSQLRADVLSTQESAVNAEEVAAVPEEAGFTQEVSIVDFAFNPATVTVEKGTTIVWTNKDPVPHTVTGTGFTSATLNAGDTFSYTFTEDGTFEYTCSFHPQMKGKVLAGEVTAQATESIEAPAGEEAEELFPSAVEETTLETATESEVIVPQDSAMVTLDAQTLLSELAAQDEAALALAQQTAVLNAAAAEAGRSAAAEHTGELADSGPEDLLYIALFGIILYFKRHTRAKRA